MDNFLDNLIYEIAIIGVLVSIFRQDNFLTIYERFWHLGGRVLLINNQKSKMKMLFTQDIWIDLYLVYVNKIKISSYT